MYGYGSLEGRRPIGPVGWTVLGGVGLLVLFLLWNAIGFISLPMQQQDINGKIGDVWNEVDRASQLLPRLEAQLKYTIASQKKVIDEIAAARNDYLAAQQSGGDPKKILQSSTSMAVALKAFVENYPSFGLTEVQQELLSSTEGSYNRIAYARHLLINAQVSYNQTRILYPLAAVFNPPIQVLGSDFKPTTPVPPSTLPTQGS